jgi:hypothetical protein
MKAFMIASLFLATASVAHADKGRCLAIDPAYQGVCSTFIIKDACNARGLMCRWLEMSVLGKLPVVQTKVEIRR